MSYCEFDEDHAELPTREFLQDLSERISHIPPSQGVDQYDAERLREIAVSTVNDIVSSIRKKALQEVINLLRGYESFGDEPPVGDIIIDVLKLMEKE